MLTKDQELLRRAGEKDHEAFRQLVEKHQGKVFRVCLGFLKNPQDAEELAQDVFFSVYKNARRFRGDAEVSTWIYRIAVNLCLNAIRDRDRLSWPFPGRRDSLEVRVYSPDTSPGNARDLD